MAHEIRYTRRASRHEVHNGSSHGKSHDSGRERKTVISAVNHVRTDHRPVSTNDDHQTETMSECSDTVYERVLNVLHIQAIQTPERQASTLRAVLHRLEVTTSAARRQETGEQQHQRFEGWPLNPGAWWRLTRPE